MGKALKMLQRIMLLQMVWFLFFVAGGVLVGWTTWSNKHLPAACSAPSRLARHNLAASACATHSYELPIILVLIGIAALFVTGYVATRLAVKYLGDGAMAFLRNGRRFVGPMGYRRGSDDTGGGFAGFSGGAQAGLPTRSSGRSNK
jgi:uncharacterized membrane protein YgcG